MKISIIIPVYNVEDYIVMCIESIIKQDFDKNDFEVLIIDDGSTDQSIRLIKERSKDIENLSIITQSSKGVSAARNAGLAVAKGEYIIFIDSDDFIEYDFCSSLYRYASKNELDVVFSSYKFYFNIDSIIEYKALYDDDRIITSEEVRKDILERGKYRAEIWDGIYKKSFLDLNTINFTEGIINEDEEFTLKVYLNSIKIGYLNYNGYLYRQRQGSITKSINFEKVISSRFILLDNFIDIFNKTNTKEKKEFILWRIDSLFEGLLINIKKSNYENDYKKSEINEYVKFLKVNNNKMQFKFIIGIKFYVNYLIFKNRLKLNIKKII